MKKIDQDKIKAFYNSVPDVWGNNDPWHNHSKEIIALYLRQQNFFKNSVVLNAGSAGNTYKINCKKMYHVDIASEKIKNIENAVVASIENLPFHDDFFDNILCVGSVLNYCDAMTAISELSRVLKPNGNLILEYESSWGFEYIGKDCYKNDACIITTEYIETKHTQWLYSPIYISQILKSSSLSIADKTPFHIADGLLSKFMNEQSAVHLTKIDNLLKRCPYFKWHGNNIILHCIKE